MSETCFLDPTAQVNNGSSDPPKAEPCSSFLHKSSAFPLQSGLRTEFQLVSFIFSGIFSHIHREGSGLKGRREMGIGFPGQCQPLTLQL